jgi:CBS domain-containing protein
MHTVAHLLANKKHWNEHHYDTNRIDRIHTVGQGESVLEAARLMNEHHVGALLVTDTFGITIGIISERDILTRVVTAELEPAITHVGDVMTRDVIHCSSSHRLVEVRQIMKESRIRHLPVIDDGDILGMVSIGDLNAATNIDLSIEVKSMRQYITSV